MRQLLYVSTAAPGHRPADVQGILQASRHNNALDGVTGLLWTDGSRFMQVIEGSDDAIETTFARIRVDPRHVNVDLVFDRAIAEREFGDWTMAYRRADDSADEFDLRVLKRLGEASTAVTGRFTSLVATPG